ncbi:hypothetical protein TNCV_1951531 [Trichonephila clavipes]|nr:hypothetical protein TNCV_1951531 [Trichonephila clavipes]
MQLLNFVRHIYNSLQKEFFFNWENRFCRCISEIQASAVSRRYHFRRTFTTRISAFVMSKIGDWSGGYRRFAKASQMVRQLMMKECHSGVKWILDPASQSDLFITK